MPMSDLNSLTLNAALNEAVEWLTAAEYAQAVARCEDLLSSYPDAVRVLSVRARALQALGETARAAAIERAVAAALADPKNHPRDLGGSADLDTVTNAIIDALGDVA